MWWGWISYDYQGSWEGSTKWIEQIWNVLRSQAWLATKEQNNLNKYEGNKKTTILYNFAFINYILLTSLITMSYFFPNSTICLQKRLYEPINADCVVE